MTTGTLLLALVALASQSPRAAASEAGSDGDCAFTVSRLWLHMNVTVNDVDDACCTALKDTYKTHSTKAPACCAGKKTTVVEWADGRACSGDDHCDLASFPIPGRNVDITSFDWYGMSAECCAFYHKLQPPLPANCPPLHHFCAKVTGSFKNNTALAIWAHDALAQLALAGDQEQTGEEVVVV